MVIPILLAAVLSPWNVYIEREAFVEWPTGERVRLPPGAEIRLCSDEQNRLMAIDYTSQFIRLYNPCTTIFSDSFEE